MHGPKTRSNSATYSWIADWVALNGSEPTWIALVTVVMIVARMSW